MFGGQINSTLQVMHKYPNRVPPEQVDITLSKVFPAQQILIRSVIQNTSVAVCEVIIFGGISHQIHITIIISFLVYFNRYTLPIHYMNPPTTGCWENSCQIAVLGHRIE